MSFFINTDNLRIIVCCGSGGVGKTTVSAALGLYCAMIGRKVLVLTIDPAKRLADSLGISGFDYEVQKVDTAKLSESGIEIKGELYGMMLDTRHVFDSLIMLYVKDKDVREKIFNNRYYQHISSSFAGTHEYMAMEKLYQIYNDNKYDLIVLDTPPSRRALDFLEAPMRLNNLLGKHFIWTLLKPYIKASKMGFQIFSFFASPVLKAINKLLGTNTLEDLADFLKLGDDSFFEGFRVRSQEIIKVLSGSTALFIAIASPMKTQLDEALFLFDQLKKVNMPFGGFIINRVHPIHDEKISDDLNGINDNALAKKLIENFKNFQKMGQSDAIAIENLKKFDSNIKVKQVPYFENDVCDLKSLQKVIGYLFD